MKNNGNKDRSRLLNELFNISKIGMEASEIILPRTQGKELREQIRRQDEGYINRMEKARALMKASGTQPTGVREGMQRMLRGAIRVNTFLQHDPQHIAELMVRGTNMGVVKMTEVMNHTPDCDVKTRKYVEDCLHAEETNADNLKRFL